MPGIKLIGVQDSEFLTKLLEVLGNMDKNLAAGYAVVPLLIQLAKPSSKFKDIKPGDYNNNGKIDEWLVDTNNNGIGDTLYVDDNEDSKIEKVYIDKNENQKWDLLVFDDDLDGYPNRQVIDKDLRGAS